MGVVEFLGITLWSVLQIWLQTWNLDFKLQFLSINEAEGGLKMSAALPKISVDCIANGHNQPCNPQICELCNSFFKLQTDPHWTNIQEATLCLNQPFLIQKQEKTRNPDFGVDLNFVHSTHVFQALSCLPPPMVSKSFLCCLVFFTLHIQSSQKLVVFSSNINPSTKLSR